MAKQLKNRQRTISPIWLAPLAVALVVAGCDRNNNSGDTPADDTGDGVFVPPPVASSFGINVVVLDENRAAVDEASVLTINDAENGDLVRDDSEILLSQDGYTRIPLNAITEPAAIRIEVEKAGFISNGGRYDIEPGESQTVEVVLTGLQTDAEGIMIADTSGDLATGDLSAAATNATDPAQVLTEVMVPQGLEILDVDGEPLNTDLTLSVVHFDSRDEQALTAFPGGFDVFIENIDEVDEPAIEGGIPSDSNEPVSPQVIFQSAGFTAIEIFDSEGRKADTFTGVIDVTMAIPPETINPETGVPIVAGDIIPVWSYDTDTASWVYEGKEPAQPDGRGGLQVTYQADHLSYWNLDYFTQASCDASIDISVLSEEGQIVEDTPVSVTILAASSSTGFQQSSTLSSGTINLQRVPAAFPVGVSFDSTIPGVDIQSVTRNDIPYNGEAFDICGAGGGGSFVVSTDTPLTEIEDASNFNYTATVIADCTNTGDDDQADRALPGVPVIYRSTDSSVITPDAYANAAGAVSISGMGNSTGMLSATYQGVILSADVEGGSGNVTFAFPTECQLTSGANG